MLIATVKKFVLKIEKPIRLYFYFSVFDLFVGLVGVLIYGIYAGVNGPIWVRNQFIGLWLTSMVTIYAILSIYLELKHMPKQRNLNFYLEFAFFASSSLVCLALSIFYGIAGKIDATIWSVYICAVNITNCYILFLKTKQISREAVETQDLGSDDSISEKSEDQFKPNTILRVLNIILQLASFIFICFILNGSIVIGTGLKKYPARGNFVDVKLDDNTDRHLKIHYLCDGPQNSSLPTFLFEGDDSHGLADYLSVQKLMKNNSLRSCIWDKPGLGFSDYLYDNMQNYSIIYHNFISSLNEKPPYIFVGWGAGGEIVFDYASKHPEMVKSLTFIDVTPNGIEFQISKTLNKWTQSQLDDYKKTTFSARRDRLRFINGLRVPWGLMSLVQPAGNTFFPELNDEVRSYYLEDKTWATQSYFLDFLPNKQNIFATTSVNQSISINLIMSYKSSQQIINQTCLKKNYAPDSANCLYEIEYNNLTISAKENLIQNGQEIKCQLDACDTDYFMNQGTLFTVQSLFKLYLTN